MEINYFNQSI